MKPFFGLMEISGSSTWISAMTTGTGETDLQMNVILLKIFRKKFHLQMATYALVLFNELLRNFGKQITAILI